MDSTGQGSIGRSLRAPSYDRAVTMILPERTVDAWTAAYITGRRWRARLWAPTEQDPSERYDLGVALGQVGAIPLPPERNPWPDKVFVLEHKGVDEDKAGPFVPVRVGQLFDHLAEDRSRGGQLVYYLLPDPVWRGVQPAPYGTVPAVAQRRTHGPRPYPGGPAAWPGFQVWAWVVHVEDLLTLLCALLLRGAGNRFRPSARRGSQDWICRLRPGELGAIPNGLSLRDFLSGVRRCTHGRLVEPGLAEPGRAIGDRPRLGPDLGDLRHALNSAWREGASAQQGQLDLPLIDLPDIDEPESDEGLAAIFARPPHTTVYGVGDSEAAGRG